MVFKPNCQGVGKGWSLCKSDYYRTYYILYKERYKQRYLEQKNKIDLKINYKQELIDLGFLIVK